MLLVLRKVLGNVNVFSIFLKHLNNMKIVFIVLTTLAISVWLCDANDISNGPSKNHSSQNCVPGTSWKNDCNNCFCTETGVAICTKKGCLTLEKWQQLQEHQRRRRSISDSTRSHNEYDTIRLHHPKNNIDPASERRKYCVPGSRWKSDCNSCWCSENGVAACTMMACLNFNNNALTNQPHRQTIRGSAASPNSIFEHGDKDARIRRSVDDDGKCIPESSWREDCNTCVCSESGFAACTYKFCLKINTNIKPAFSNRRRRSSSTVLTPATAGTTRFRDSSPPENGNKCMHGTTWMDDCNRCRCFRGHSACTRMMCPSKEINIKNVL